MRWIILSLLVISLVLTGCESSITKITGNDLPLQAPAPEFSINPEQVIDLTPIITEPTVIPTTEPPNTTQAGSIILQSAIVIASSVRPGNSGSSVVEVDNTSGAAVEVKIAYREPDNLRPGYSYFGDQAKSWVTINPDSLIVPANGKNTSTVTITVPDNYKLPPETYEFWLSYSYASGGFLNYILNQRWLLNSGTE